MAAVWMRLLAEMRARWRAWLALALMFGLAAGASIAAIAGASRTDTAYPRFLQAQDAFDALTGGGAEDQYDKRFEAIQNLPEVEDAVTIIIIGGEFVVPAKAGDPEQVVTLPEAIVATDPEGRTLYETNRAKVLEGRMADRSRPDEALVPFTLAERYGIEVGDRIFAGVGFDFERFPRPLQRVPVTVVGIVAAPGDFESVGQTAYVPVYVTPALFEKYREIVPELNPDTWNLAVHLRGGPAAATAFKQKIEREFDLDVPITQPVTTSGVQKAMRLYTAALALLGALIAVAAVTIFGQTLARQQVLDSAEHPALRAIGASPGQILMLGMGRAAAVGAVAASVAALTAFLLSPLSPIGTARVAEPHPGFAFDADVIGIGAAITLLLVPLGAIIPALRAVRLVARGEAAQSTVERAKPSRIVERVSRATESPAAVTGLRMALERGRGRTAVPVRSTIFAVAIGVAAVTGSVVVGQSLNHLIETPALAGFTYDAILPEPPADAPEMSDQQMADRLAAYPFVDRTTVGTGMNVVFQGVDAFVVAFEQGAPIGFATIKGRAPTDAVHDGSPEISVGPATARRLGLELGDSVEFLFASQEGDSEVKRGSQRALVVGVAAIPPLPFAATEPGEGAVMTVGAIRGFSPNDAGGCCFVRFKPGTDLTTARTTLEEDGWSTFLRTKRADLATLERITRLPILLSILFGAMAAAALAHVLVTAIRRRRRDLAILKTLGFVQRQVRSAVAWQASAVALLAVVAGIPAGVVLGRWGWRLVASEFGVVPVSVDPILTLALVLPAALILANIVAAIPGRVAARTKPALVLRTE
jgi:ABC-type lipoprotein release transport system permease subunit